MQPDLVSAPHTGNHTIFPFWAPWRWKDQPGSAPPGLSAENGVPAEQILIMVPQRTLAMPFFEALHCADFPPGTAVDVATVGGLARRLLDLFWPLGRRDRPDSLNLTAVPGFLTLETTQYFMDRVAEPFIASGLFDGITISRARLGSQIIDNLNKSAAVGFSPGRDCRPSQECLDRRFGSPPGLRSGSGSCTCFPRFLSGSRISSTGRCRSRSSRSICCCCLRSAAIF